MVEQDIVIKWRSRMLTDNQIQIIVEIFESPSTTYEIFYLMDEYARITGIAQPNRVIRDALLDGLLYVDNITDEREIMLGLTRWGEDEWEAIHE